MFNLEGIYAPIPAPFTSRNGPLDFDGLSKNMEFWNQSNLDGLVVLGSNGEFVAMNEREKKELVKAVCGQRSPGKGIVVGCGFENTKDSIMLCEYSASVGANAALVLSPCYYKSSMTEKVLSDFFTEVADASPIPIVLYNMPGNSGINLSSSLVASLAVHPNIIGVKDSSGNIVQIMEIIRDTDESFSVFAGSASFLLPTLIAGGNGGTLALANVLPNECAKLYRLVNEGNIPEAVALQLHLLEANKAVTAKYGIGGLKAAMEIIGYCGGSPRSPLPLLGDADRQALKKIIEAAQTAY